MLASLFFSFIESSIRNISGSLGIRIRYFYYSRRFGSCGKNVQIDIGVCFHSLKDITIGNNVVIDKYSILIGGQKQSLENVNVLKNINNINPGEISIGSNSHIGISSIIQGHGGVRIGDYFTSSAGCKIYTLSNDPSKCEHGTLAIDGSIPFYIMNSIFIDDNVWLGLNVSVVGGNIATNVFIKPYSLVLNNIDSNSVAAGQPAIIIKNRF